MFGYIKPCKPELQIKEYGIYKGVYCSICKCLSENFGVLSKFILSYDSTFLALLCFSLMDICPSFEKGRCTVNPLKKCSFCNTKEKSIVFASVVCTIMAYYKVLDDIHDSKSIKKLKAYSIIPFVKHSYKKAKSFFPEIDEIILKQMINQKNAENDDEINLDKAAESTAIMLSEIMGLLPLDAKQMRIVKEFSYFLGRWIYLVDAADDFYIDKKSKNFNPFINEFEKKKTDCEKNYMKAVLNQTLARILAAYNLMKLNKFKSIIDNIVILGLLETQKKILEKEME